MTFLVTGGSGFTGSRVVAQLVAAGHQPQVMCRSSQAAATVTELGASAIDGDLDDAASVQSAFEKSGADTLINVASLGFGHVQTIIDATKAAGIKRSIFVSTTAIFTKLPAPSKARRVAAEDAIATSGLNATIIRPTMIYGAPGDRNLERLIALLRKTPLIPVPGRGNHLQQPIYVDDLARAIVNAATATELPDFAYDVAGPQPLAFRDIIEQTTAALDRRVRILPVPLAPIRAVLGIYERLTSTPRLKVEQLDRLEEDKSFDTSAAVRDLDFSSRSFADGITQEVDLIVESAP